MAKPADSLISEHAPATANRNSALGLYVHVPFCEQQCAYCDFFTLTDPRREHPLFDCWLDLCAAELALWLTHHPALRGRAITSIFFGGGTPSLLPASYFAAFLAAVRKIIPVAADAEISLETQPGTIASDDFPAYAAAGINRFSVGVQTFNPTFLLPTGRRHSVADSEATLQAAQATGATLAMDLICSLPGQSLEQWQADLERALQFSPRHMSVYEMTYHAGTDYYRQWKKGRIRPADDDVRAQMFRHTRARMQAAGYEHYEISNYARPGWRSRHNQVYWQLGDFVGLGAGAHSYVAGHRYANPRSARDYAKAIGEHRLFARSHDSPDPDITLIENLQMALRLIEGVNLDRLAQVVGQDIRKTRAAKLRELINRGWLEITSDNRLRLTAEGQLLGDSAVEELL